MTNTCGVGNFHYLVPDGESDMGQHMLGDMFPNESYERDDIDGDESIDGEVLEPRPGEFAAWNEGEKPKG